MYKVLVDNGRSHTMMTYEQACSFKGIKPLVKPKPYRRSTKDRPKSFLTADHWSVLKNDIRAYVETWLRMNNLKTERTITNA